MKTIPVRALRNEYARIIREVGEGESFTVTSEGRPVASISPYTPPETAGPQTWVPAERLVGGLEHLGPGLAARLRADLEDGFDDELPIPSLRRQEEGGGPDER